MKLLFALSPHLVTRLAAEYPHSAHGSAVGIDQSLDIEVWMYARDYEFTIVTKDADFSDMSVLLGFPPKVVWLRVGNCSTSDIEANLRAHTSTLDALAADPTIGIIELF